MIKKKNDWVVYPDVELTVDDLKQHINMVEQNEINLPEGIVTEAISGEVETLITEDESIGAVNLQPELTEEEKRANHIQQLKNAQKTFKTKKKFGVSYKKERKRKNKMVKTSRSRNR